MGVVRLGEIGSEGWGRGPKKRAFTAAAAAACGWARTMAALRTHHCVLPGLLLALLAGGAAAEEAAGGPSLPGPGRCSSNAADSRLAGEVLSLIHI